MRVRLETFLVFVVAMFSAVQEVEAGCPGDPGLILSIDPPQVPIGTSFAVSLTAPPGSLSLILLSHGAGPTPTPWGILCVGPSLVGVAPVPMYAPTVTFNHFVDCNAAFVGITGHFQFLNLDPAKPGQVGLSNSASITIVTNSCGSGGFDPGDMVTFTQGGWGAKCCGNNPGCLRDAHFAAVFPCGLVLGDHDGPDWDCFHAVLLTCAKAVENFLPAGGPPGKLCHDYVNPLTTSAGVFAGQLTAAKMNVGFDTAGIFDPMKTDPAVKLKDLIFVANVHPKIKGYSVEEIIYISDMVISGELPTPVDLDGNLVGDVNESDLSNALDALNNNFDNGTINQGSLGMP
ncbi:MAG: hypothetical protein HY812_20525 [Planctomycetes bacterium]|nr:hypothetical protein [Planctomycetota bacterium]